MDFRVYYEQQKRLQKEFEEKYPKSAAVHSAGMEENEARLEKHMVLMIRELIEILDEINYKPHVPRKPVSKDRITEEMVDTFKYFLNLMLIMGIEPYEFERKYAEKHKVVEQRIGVEEKNENV